jgi:hypothetical protein
MLGVAYGVLQTGILDQALFNPDFNGHDCQGAAHVPRRTRSAPSWSSSRGWSC